MSYTTRDNIEKNQLELLSGGFTILSLDWDDLKTTPCIGDYLRSEVARQSGENVFLSDFDAALDVVVKASQASLEESAASLKRMGVPQYIVIDWPKEKLPIRPETPVGLRWNGKELLGTLTDGVGEGKALFVVNH